MIKAIFSVFFKMDLTDDELKKALQYFSGSDEIYSRLKEVLNAGYLGEYVYLMPARKNRLDQTALLKKASAWKDERARFCKKENEMDLYKVLGNAEVLFSTNSEVYKKREDIYLPNASLFDFIGDMVVSKKIDKSNRAYALLEATYGISADYELSWVICHSLLDVDIDFRKYFEFWKGGGFDVLLEDKLLIAYFLKS